VTDDVLIVDRFIFAKLLGVRSTDGHPFHQQGNFLSHGFFELSLLDGQRIAFANGLGEVDSHSMRFFRHKNGAFTRNNREGVIEQLEWTRS
jgi:hypothetical protein